MASSSFGAFFKNIANAIFPEEDKKFEVYQNGLLQIPPGVKPIFCDDSAITKESGMLDLLLDMLRPAENLEIEERQRFAILGHSKAAHLDGKLFPHAPRQSDVQQEMHGSCYLAGPAIAMTSTMPIQLMSMMREDDDGKTVVVRLFDKAGDPHYYRVPKTDIVPMHSRFLYHNSEAWYAILFKVYVHHIMRTDPERAKRMVAKNTGAGGKSVVASSVSGSATEAFSAITGVKADASWVLEIPLETVIRKPFTEKFQAYQKDLKELTKIRDREISTHPDYARILTELINLYRSLACFNRRPTLAEREALGNLCVKVHKEVAEFWKKNSKYKALEHQFRNVSEIANKLMEYNTLHNALKVRIDRYPATIKLTDEHYKSLFQDMQNALRQGSVITVATPEKFALPAQGSPTSREYVEGHEYAVLETVERLDKGQKKYFVRLLNPWQQKADTSEPSASDPTRYKDDKINHGLYSQMRNKQAGEKLYEDEPNLFLTLATLNGKGTDFSGVSEIAIEDFVKLFDIVTVEPAANEYSLVLNQIFTFMQYIRMHCTLPKEGQPDFDPAFNARVDTHFAIVSGIILNPNKNDFEKIVDVQNVLRSEVMLKLAEKNVLLKLFLKILEPLFTLINKKAPSEDIIEELTTEFGVLAKLRILGEDVKKYHVPAVDEMRKITNYWNNMIGMFVARSKCDDILKNPNLSVKEKCHEFLTMLSNRDNIPILYDHETLDKMKINLGKQIVNLTKWEKDLQRVNLEKRPSPSPPC